MLDGLRLPKLKVVGAMVLGVDLPAQPEVTHETGEKSACGQACATVLQVGCPLCRVLLKHLGDRRAARHRRYLKYDSVNTYLA